MIYNERILMESDSDATLVATLSVGTNILDETVICLAVSDYGRDGKHVPTRRTMAVIDGYEMKQLASRWNIEPSGIGNFIANKFEDNGYISRIGYVRKTFQRILYYILDNGGKYQIK